MPLYYKLLDDGSIEVTDDISEIYAGPIRVGDTTIGDARVSTVFLQRDHNFGNDGMPILFETMVFGGDYDQEQERYCTVAEAEEGHAKWVKLITPPEPPPPPTRSFGAKRKLKWK